jgi:hypothetical protein
MPIPLNTVRVAEISLKGVIGSGGSNTVNTNFVFHFRRSSVAVNPSKSALNTIFQSAISAKIALALNHGWEAALNDIRWVNDAEDAYVSFTNTDVGAITGDRLDSFTAAYLLFRTGLRGREFRGSKHLGPLSESDVTTTDEDIWNTGCLTRLAAINTALLAGMTDSTGNVWNFTILSRSLSQLEVNPTDVIVNDVTATLVNKRSGSMLRRKVKSVY